MSAEQFDEMGPIDYVVLEWPGTQPQGEVAPLILDLVDRGIIRILDVALMAKDADGTVGAMDFGALDGETGGFEAFEGAATGILGQEDLEEAAAALEPNSAAAVLVWENRWAAPVAVARAQVGRPADRQRPHPRPGHPRLPRRARGRGHQLREEH